MSEQPSSWQGFFDTIAPRDMQECFARDALREVEFIVRELKLEGPQRILDVGCGTAGQWEAHRPLELDEIEIMARSHKR